MPFRALNSRVPNFKTYKAHGTYALRYILHFNRHIGQSAKYIQVIIYTRDGGRGLGEDPQAPTGAPLMPPVTHGHVIMDLSEAGKNGDHTSIVKFLSDGPANHIPIEKLLKLFPLSGDCSDEKVPRIGALTIPASSSGLDTVNQLPSLVKDCMEFVCERKTEKKKSDHDSPLPWA